MTIHLEDILSTLSSIVSYRNVFFDPKFLRLRILRHHLQ